eukprot:UN27529
MLIHHSFVELDILILVVNIFHVELIVYDSVIPKEKIMVNLLQFEFKNSIQLFWDGKAYLIAIAVVICLAVIPFIIHALLLYIMFARLRYRIFFRRFSYVQSLIKLMFSAKQ